MDYFNLRQEIRHLARVDKNITSRPLIDFAVTAGWLDIKHKIILELYWNDGNSEFKPATDADEAMVIRIREKIFRGFINDNGA